MIASVTRPFCGDCDRVRLTADGQVRNCLFAREESDLRGALRGGADDAEIADRWRAAMMTKRPGHGIDDAAVPAARRARCRPSAADGRRPRRPRDVAGTRPVPATRPDRMPAMRLFAAIVPPRDVLDEVMRRCVRSVDGPERRARGAEAPAARPFGGRSDGATAVVEAVDTTS